MHTNTFENQRLIAMQRYLNFSFEKDNNLKDIAMLASNLMETPVSLITLMDKDVQWIIAPHGIDIKQMPRETSFCTHTIVEDDVMVVSDACKDDRFKDSPLVKYNPNVRFYAGVPLKSDDGFMIGTLCVLDDKPRQTEDYQLKCLKALTRQVNNIMDLNLSLQVIKENHKEINKQYKALQNIAYVQSHEVRAPLCNAMGVMELIRMEEYQCDRLQLTILDKALNDLDHKIHKIVKQASGKSVAA